MKSIDNKHLTENEYLLNISIKAKRAAGSLKRAAQMTHCFQKVTLVEEAKAELEYALQDLKELTEG